MSDASSEQPRPGHRIGSWFAGLSEGISAVRAPAVMSVITVLALWLPQQVWELYRVLMQERAKTEPIVLQYQWLVALLALSVLSFVLWQITRELTHAASERDDLDRNPVAKFILDWSPRLFATAPFVGAALGMWQSLPPTRISTFAPEILADPAMSEIFERLRGINRHIRVGIGLAAIAAALVFLLITFFERAVLQVRAGRQLTESRGRRLFFINYWFLFPIVGIILIALFSWDPVHMPRNVGVIPIFALWAAICTVLLAAGTRMHDRHRVPIVTIALIALVVFEFFGWSDNHRFRRLPEPANRTDVDTAFMDWLGSRADAKAYRDAGKPYPVYIVAAEGGGMYAAYHTAKFLARLQDMCPQFSQHVFAASTVSGGTLGAAVFAALAQKHSQTADLKACAQVYGGKAGDLEQQAEKVLSHDFLSPLIYAGLFPDFVQRFLPVRIDRFDRALALERSFEFAWQQAHPQEKANPFAASFFDLCSAGSSKCPKEAVTAPALIINTTNVETGMQMVLSPVDLGATKYWPGGNIEDLYITLSGLTQIPLSTAVGLSARFPWVLPVGWHEFTQPMPEKKGIWADGVGPQKRRLSFVDGGYFEGSGVVTADNLAQYLDRLIASRSADLAGLKVSIKIVMITGTYAPVDRFFNTEQETYGLGEITSPVATLLQAWRARNSAFPNEFAGEKRKGPISALPARFDNDVISIALGWQLTNLSRDYLTLFTGKPENCKLIGPADDPISEPLLSMNDSDCTVKAILSELQPPSARP